MMAESVAGCCSRARAWVAVARDCVVMRWVVVSVACVRWRETSSEGGGLRGDVERRFWGRRMGVTRWCGWGTGRVEVGVGGRIGLEGVLEGWLVEVEAEVEAGGERDVAEIKVGEGLRMRGDLKGLLRVAWALSRRRRLEEGRGVAGGVVDGISRVWIGMEERK